MAMSLRLSLLFLALLNVTGIMATESRAKGSCMVHWMVRAGVSRATSRRAEQRLLLVGSSTREISQTGTNIVSFLLQTTPAESNKLRSCFAGSSKTCTKYSPCKHGGKCMLSRSKKEHICNCPLHYSGVFCQIPHPAPLRDLRLLEKSVQKLTQDVKSLQTRGNVWKCHYPFLARKHFTWHSSDKVWSGQLRSVTFVKKQEHTALRLLYSSNIREWTARQVALWSFRIDGQECSLPAKISIAKYVHTRMNIHIPSVLLGTCQATSRGRIGKGRHTISVHVTGDTPVSGWKSTSFLEIKEICPDGL